MQRHTSSFSICRILAATLVIAGAAPLLRADAIQFSKPAVEIVGPQKAPDLPEPKSKSIEFGSGSGFDRPVMSPPPVVRIPPPPRRERDDEDEDAQRHPLLRDLRDPGKLSDFPDRSDERNPANSNKSPSSRNRAAAVRAGTGSNKSFEGQHALSPITDPDWNPREGEIQERQERSEARSQKRSETGERADSRERDLYGKRDDDAQQRSPFDAPPVPDPFSFHPRENSATAQMERRAAFEELFNPGAPMGKPAGSLEPVAALETAKAAAPTVMPMLGRPKPELTPAEPPNAFKAQAGPLLGLGANEFGSRFAQPPAKTTAVNPTESRSQTSLMRQPTVHDIPTRRGL